MKRRLLDTATVLLDKFVNRYHDYEDFWAIGVLYSYCQSLDQSSLTFNLIDRDCFGRDEFLKQVNIKFSDDLDKYLIYAELSGDFPLGDSRQPTYKSLRPFDLVS